MQQNILEFDFQSGESRVDSTFGIGRSYSLYPEVAKRLHAADVVGTRRPNIE